MDEPRRFDKRFKDVDYIQAALVDDLLADVQDIQKAAADEIEAFRNAIRGIQESCFRRCQTVVDDWTSRVTVSFSSERARAMLQSQTLASLPKSPEEIGLAGLVQGPRTSISSPEGQLSTPPRSLADPDERDVAAREDGPVDPPQTTHNATTSDSDAVAIQHGPQELLQQRKRAPFGALESPGSSKRPRRQFSRSSRALREIKKSEVANEWVFEYPNFGEGFFILRCTNGTTNKIHKFDRDPFNEDRALKHFQETSLAGCHDISEDYHGRLDEMVRCFGRRVVDATPGWVRENNAGLESRTARREPPQQPAADMGGVTFIADDASDTEMEIDNPNEEQEEDDNNDDEGHRGNEIDLVSEYDFPVVSDIVGASHVGSTATKTIDVSDLAENEFVIWNPRLVSGCHVIRCGNVVFDKDPLGYRRAVDHFNSDKFSCHAAQVPAYHKNMHQEIIRDHGVKVLGIRSQEAVDRNRKIDARIRVPKSKRKAIRKGKTPLRNVRISDKRPRMSVGGMQSTTAEASASGGLRRQTSEVDVNHVIAEMQPFLNDSSADVRAGNEASN